MNLYAYVLRFQLSKCISETIMFIMAYSTFSSRLWFVSFWISFRAKGSVRSSSYEVNFVCLLIFSYGFAHSLFLLA